MTIPDPNFAGYSEAAATVFTWLADKVLGGAKKALGWGWERAQWAAAQDRYDAQIIKQYGWIRIFGQTSPKPLREVFTDVYMLDKPTALRRFDPDALRKHLWDEDRSLPFRYGERLPADQLLSRGTKFFILGKPGAGKTTFLKHLAVREAQRGRGGPCLGKIPIFVPLKQFSESRKSLFDFIVEQFAVCHFPDAAPFVERLLKEGQALVLFDGLDEVTKDTAGRADRRGQVTEQIEQFTRQYDGCHIVVTCRIAATEYTFDPAFVYLELADFAPDQVDVFVRNWFWDAAKPDAGIDLADRMLTEWAKPEHAGIRDLGRNPLLLTLLCLNYAETFSFPPRRVEIYQEALDALLKKWDSSRQIQRGSLYKSLSLGRKQQMFSRIAYDGFTKGKLLVPQVDLEAQIKAYLVHVPEMPDAVDIDGEAVLREIVAQHGIFAEQSRGLFSFAHLTFQEYYAAKYFAESPASDLPDQFMSRMTDAKWREVLLLSASLLPDGASFLSTFEQALQTLVARQPRLHAWLWWIAQWAAAAQAPYKASAMRLYRARDVLIGSNDYARDDFLPIIEIDRDLFLDIELDRRLQFAVEIAFTGDLGNMREFRSLLIDPIVINCQQRRRNDLAIAIQALTIPSAASPSEDWENVADQLERVIESSGTLVHFKQLCDAASHLVVLPQLRKEDRVSLAQYIAATRLFYDCLQLAYTPDRRAFEDRIFLPSPLTDEKA